MLLLRISYKWRGSSFLGYHFIMASRGRKLYVIFLFVVGSAYAVWCSIVLSCGRKSLLPVLYRIIFWYSWGYWCPWWGFWPGCGYTAGRRWYTIIPLSWFYLDTLWLERVPWKTLIKGTGFLHTCVKNPAYIFQKRVSLTLGIWFSFEKWLLFCDAPPRLCSLVCHVLFLGIIPAWWRFWPICAPVRGFWLSVISSLWHFWLSFSECGTLGIPYQTDVGSHCHVEVHGVFCIIVYTLFEGCTCVCSPL